MNHVQQSSRGSAPIYISLFIGLLITSAAISLGGTLTRQLRASQDIVATERAFSAGNAGSEAVLFELRRGLEAGNTGEEVQVSGSIPYDDGEDASYEAEGRFILSEDQTSAFPCVSGKGRYQDTERRVEFRASPDCEL